MRELKTSEIESLELEMDAAYEKYGYFHSTHEANFGRSRLASIADRARNRGINIQGKKVEGERYFIYKLES